MEKLSVRDCIAAGWKTFTTRPWFFIGVWVLIFIVSLVSNGIRSLASTHGVVLSILAFLLSVAVSIFSNLGQTRVALLTTKDGTAVRVRDLWAPSLFWKYAVVYLLLGVLVVLGLILFIIPGIFASIVWMFANYLVVDKGYRPFEALKESARLTKGHRWQLLLLSLALLGINILGCIALLVGLLVSIPVSVFAVAHAYRTLSKESLEEIPLRAV